MEVDWKWMFIVLYGGSGGWLIEFGFCVEELDIEIGVGVLLKVISWCMVIDKGGSNGFKLMCGYDDDGNRW